LSDSFVAFSKGGDLMVADAYASTSSLKLPPARQRLIERLREFHATPRECVEMATRAGVKRLVLTHHLPGANPDIEFTSYPGDVIVGNDLDRFEI
jgi:ribonuclease BN (tRNA processing enzyme)